MAKDIFTQWTEAIWGAERPLFVLPPNVDTDIFAAACALGHALHNTGKGVTILCPRTMSTHAQFLVGNLFITKTLEATRTYQCTLPQTMQVDHLTHELFKQGGGTITLYLAHTPSSLEPLSFTSTLPAFDRIIILGARDLSEVAPLFEEEYHLLTKVPLVSIHWRPDSEPFGHWNILSQHATTVSEVVAHLLQETSPHSVKDHIATCLLAGIIAKTKHFRSELVTPQMLNLSADLVAAGAQRLKIIEELYRTRSLDTLRLWGTVCARLQEVAPDILFSELTADDFLRTHTSTDTLPDIAQEILQGSDKVHKIIFFYPENGTFHAHVTARHPHDARIFLGALRTEGTKDTAHHTFTPETTAQDVLKYLKDELLAPASQKTS